MVLIYIIRHGETDMNTSGKVNDANIDKSINAKGKNRRKRQANI
jgi:broad specificity phosphatase PhoE